MIRFTPRAASGLFPSIAHCTCFASLPARVRHYAASPTSPPVDKLLLAARKTLDRAAANNESGSIEAAKRDRELDGLRAALADVTDGEEVRFPFRLLRRRLGSDSSLRAPYSSWQPYKISQTMNRILTLGN